MKKIIKFLLLLLIVGSLSSCTKKNKLNYEDFINKLDSKESFAFVITQNSCSGCKEYKPIIKEYNKSHTNIIYEINWDSLESTEQIVLAAKTYEFFGLNYYKQHDATSAKVITPTTIKVVDGVFERGETKVLQLDEITSLLESKVVSLHDFYGFTRKTANKDSFMVCFYTSENQLSPYFQEINTEVNELFLLDLNLLDEGDTSRLLGRINYFYNEFVILDQLESHFMLTYEDGAIISYSKID